MHPFGQVPSSRIAAASISLIVLQARAPAVAPFVASPPLDSRGSAVASSRDSGDAPRWGPSSAERTERPSQGRRRRASKLAPQQLGEFEPINLADPDGGGGRPTGRGRRGVWLYDFVAPTRQLHPAAADSRTVPYHEAWNLQKRLVEQQLSRIGKRPTDRPTYDQFVPEGLDAQGEDFLLGCDSIVIVEHDPVYTLGTASDLSFIHGNGGEVNSNDVPTVRIERGGEVTYHGPGQLTIYPILDLRGYKQDIHWYMRALEEVALLALEKAGVKGAAREENLTGVWVANKKIAAVGIKVRRWVTMHGFAVNVDTRSLEKFEGIVPCGLEGRAVTCLNDEMATVSHYTVEEFTVHLKEALEEIFSISLVTRHNR